MKESEVSFKISNLLLHLNLWQSSILGSVDAEEHVREDGGGSEEEESLDGESNAVLGSKDDIRLGIAEVGRGRRDGRSHVWTRNEGRGGLGGKDVGGGRTTKRGLNLVSFTSLPSLLRSASGRQLFRV